MNKYQLILLIIIGYLTLAIVPCYAINSSINFSVNAANEHDYGLQLNLPATFGEAEFTLELWVLLDNSFAVGPVNNDSPEQLLNWSNIDNQPYSSSDWWFKGNFLLDGHNNASGAGTFSLQIYGGGRLRWLFDDSSQQWAVQAYPANTTASLLDDWWHHITLVRRWAGSSDASLEMYIDGILIATEISSSRTNMRSYWDNWIGFPSDEQGWFWGAEKQAAKVGGLSQYEDYKGLIDELHFWSRAKSASEIQLNYATSLIGDEAGLLSWFAFNEMSGAQSCDNLDTSTCIELIRMQAGFWRTQNAPLVDNINIFQNGFE